MTFPIEPPSNNQNIQGEPLDLDELLEFAIVDLDDIESAAQWWDDTATPAWIGALDSEPTEGE